LSPQRPRHLNSRKIRWKRIGDNLDHPGLRQSLAAVPDGIRDNLSGEGEEQVRPLDHDRRLDLLCRDVVSAKDAGIIQLEFEKYVLAFSGTPFEQQANFIGSAVDLPGVDVDLGKASTASGRAGFLLLGRFLRRLVGTPRTF
jgi:hypothetical protein